MFRVKKWGRFTVAILSVLFLGFLGTSAEATSPNAGTLDPTFTTNFASSGGTTMFYTSAAEQPDGKIVLGSEHSPFIKRLNADGTLDAAFHTALGTSFNNSVTAVAIQPDGGIIVGGIFTSFNGTSVGPVVRLTSSGALDTAFSANAASVIGQTQDGVGFARVQAITVSSGRIYVGGNFAGGSASGSHLAHLNTDGTLGNASYNLIDGIVATLIPLADGGTLAGGSFSGWGLSTNLMKIDSNDSLDYTFGQTLSAPNGYVQALAQGPNGDIYVGGDFTQIGSTSVGRLAKVSSAGVLDTTFNTNIGSGFDDTVTSVVAQLDGSVFAVGNFQNYKGTPVGFGVELSSTGTTDTTFMANFGTGFDNFHSRAIKLSTGNILAYGRFGCYAGTYPGCTGGTTVNYLANIRATPTYTVRYNSNQGSGTIANTTFITSATIANGSALSRGGYSFGGWNTSAQGNGTPVSINSSYTTAADLGLFAVWTPQQYSVTYSTGTGASTQTAGSYTTGGSFTLPTAPTRSGYTFTNWTVTDSDSTTHVVNQNASYSPVGYGNITVVANWTAIAPSPSPSPTQSGSTTSANSSTGPLASTGFTPIALFIALPMLALGLFAVSRRTN